MRIAQREWNSRYVSHYSPARKSKPWLKPTFYTGKLYPYLYSVFCSRSNQKSSPHVYLAVSLFANVCSILQDIVFASRNRKIIHFSRQFGACSPIKSDDFELTFLIAINDKNIGCSAATGICCWGHRFIHDVECKEQVNFSFPTVHHVTGLGQPHQPWSCSEQTWDQHSQLKDTHPLSL